MKINNQPRGNPSRRVQRQITNCAVSIAQCYESMFGNLRIWHGWHHDSCDKSPHKNCGDPKHTSSGDQIDQIEADNNYGEPNGDNVIQIPNALGVEEQCEQCQRCWAKSPITDHVLAAFMVGVFVGMCMMMTVAR